MEGWDSVSIEVMRQLPRARIVAQEFIDYTSRFYNQPEEVHVLQLTLFDSHLRELTKADLGISIGYTGEISDMIVDKAGGWYLGYIERDDLASAIVTLGWTDTFHDIMHF